MDRVAVGVLTISDRCFLGQAQDKSGPGLEEMLRDGVVRNCTVVKTDLVPDNREDIELRLKTWSSEGIDLILTTGGTGVEETDVTPEATMSVVEKTIPGISQLMLLKNCVATPHAALTRAVVGVRGKTLIVNLPGSVKGSKECLEAIACVIPHAVDLITGRKKNVKSVHASPVEKKKSLALVCGPANRIRISPYPCISVSEAQEIILNRIYLLRRVTEVEYEKALFHVLAQDVHARDNLPPFEASLKDGYAVLSSDVDPSREVIGTSVAGGLPVIDIVPSGSCVRVNTGARLPPGTDAVVQVEDTRVLESTDSNEERKIQINKLPEKGADVRPIGSDFKVGQLILSAGTYLDSPAIGLLAATGVTLVQVYRKPTVAVISTGDELVDPGEPVRGAKIRDSNRVTVISLLKEENFEAVDVGIAKDEPDDLLNALERGFRTADIIVTTGSMSMGERDHLKRVLVVDFNAEILFGRVLMKPGKPVCFAVVDFEGKPKFVFGLPGNPASTFVTSQMFLLPALRKISKFERVFPLSVRATVVNPIPLEDRPHYVRGTLKMSPCTMQFTATTTGDQRSSNIGSCVGANCLLVFPKKTETSQRSASVSPSQPKPSSQSRSDSNYGCSKSGSTYGVEREEGGPTEKGREQNETESTGVPLHIQVQALLIGRIYT